MILLEITEKSVPTVTALWLMCQVYYNFESNGLVFVNCRIIFSAARGLDL